MAGLIEISIMIFGKLLAGMDEDRMDAGSMER